jgi:hypothetical protein
MNKNITFLASLPRSGNTLLGALLNQNPDVAVTANSITMEIFKEVYYLKETEVFQNFPDHDSLDNVLRAILPAYYRDWTQTYIIDRSPAGTPGNQMILNYCMDEPPRAILLVRNLTDIFASFLKVISQQETLTPEKCDHHCAFPGRQVGRLRNFPSTHEPCTNRRSAAVSTGSRASRSEQALRF